MGLDEQIELFLRKADADEAAMATLVAAKHINPSIIGFHAQQAVEKRLKALLLSRRLAFPRTHDIQTLIDLLEKAEIVLPVEVGDAIELTPFAVALRYDDPLSDNDSLAVCRIVKITACVREWISKQMTV